MLCGPGRKDGIHPLLLEEILSSLKREELLLFRGPTIFEERFLFLVARQGSRQLAPTAKIPALILPETTNNVNCLIILAQSLFSTIVKKSDYKKNKLFPN